MAISQPVPILTINYTETQSSTITDLTGTTWVFDDELSLPIIIGDYATFNINFTSNSTNYTQLVDNSDSSPLDKSLWLQYNNTLAYEFAEEESVVTIPPTWYNENYKTIQITSGTDVTNSTLINWLQANATQQTSGNQYEITETLTNLTSGNKTIQITPDTGYYLPSSITVTNGTLVSYNSTTGVAVISGDNAVVTVECSDTPSTISFTIAGTTYYAGTNMTWADWVESEYNTGGYSNSYSYNLGRNAISKIISGISVVVCSTQYNAVFVTDTIQSGATYTLETPAGGSND